VRARSVGLWYMYMTTMRIATVFTLLLPTAVCFVPSIFVPSVKSNDLLLRRGRAQLQGDMEDNDDGLTALKRRIASLQTSEAKVQCLVLDAMVPLQRLPLQIGPPFVQALRECQATGRPLCMLGIDPALRSVLKTGVEARVESLTKVPSSPDLFECVLIGGRRFQLLETDELSSSWPPAERLFTATVKWLDEPLQGDAETIKRAEALKPLVDEWIKLVVSTGREREPGQMERLLGDLGPMPEAESPDDRALWVSALINPLPALGVALEIRPAALSASSALERVEVAQTGLLDSIERLKRPGPTF
jgi:hypothetical protein